MQKDAGYVRCYSKNDFYTGLDVATCLWVGDYQNGEDFHELATQSEGIARLAVLRADVDNLGQAFVAGFESEKYGQRYVTLSRTATFSRKLALFFKRHINTLLEQGQYFLTDEDDPCRKATVVYSGGDDLFLIGAWDDILGFAVDLYDALGEYSQNTLTISAGIGLYPEKYPVSTMAKQTGALEDAAKAVPGKNAVALFDAQTVYPWPIFVEKVLEEKYRLISDFFGTMQDYGKAFLYHLLELMRRRADRINLARYAYLLARMEPAKGADDATRETYRRFSQQMYQWMLDEEECRQAITALTIYVYTIRDKQEG
jgi:CRISPR-associated protein Csm1